MLYMKIKFNPDDIIQISDINAVHEDYCTVLYYNVD